MKSDQNIVAIVISIVSLILCYTFLWRLNKIEMILESGISAPTQIQDISVLLDRNAKIFIALVSSLFTILTFVLGLLGYGWIQSKLDSLSSSTNSLVMSTSEDSKKMFDTHINRINDLGLNFANTIMTTADLHKGKDDFNYAFQTLMGLATYRFYGIEKGIQKQTEKIINDSLFILNNSITKIETSNQPTRNLLWTYLSELALIRTPEIITEVNKIRSKIKDTDGE